MINMSLPNVPNQIPASAWPFFQEYNVDLLDVDEHASLIIERLLAYGNRVEVRWLIETYDRERIRGWITQSGMNKLASRRYHLWCFVFNLPEKDKPVRIWQH